MLAVLEDCGIAIDHRRSAVLEQQLAGIQRFRQGLETAFPFPEQWAAQAPDELILCRCEEVSVGDVRAVVDEGHWEINRVKAHCRVGMGRCQGRMCGLAAAEMIPAPSPARYTPSTLLRPALSRCGNQARFSAFQVKSQPSKSASWVSLRRAWAKATASHSRV